MPGAARVSLEGRIAFVLGGGGQLGAHEVGMLQALVEHGVRANVVVGTSIGAVNGAWYAADPSVESVRRLADLWRSGGGIGEPNLYLSDEWLNRTIRLAIREAEEWVEANRAGDEP